MNTGFLRFVIGCGMLAFLSSVPGYSQSKPSPPTTVKSTNEAPKNFLGQFSSGIYSNEYFRFQMVVPESYFVMNRAEIEVLGKVTVDTASKGGERNSKGIEDA